MFILIVAAIVIILRKRHRNSSPNRNSIDLTQRSSFLAKGEIEDIVIDKLIGQGNFSQVFLGVMLVLAVFFHLLTISGNNACCSEKIKKY